MRNAFVLVMLAMVLTACGRHFGVPPASPTGPISTDTPAPSITLTSTQIPNYSRTTTSTVTFTYTPVPTASLSPTNTPTTTGTPTSTFASTNTPIAAMTATTLISALSGAPDLNLTYSPPPMYAGVTTLSGGPYYFNCVHIGSSCTVSISGGVTIFTTCFTLDAGATITGVATGYPPFFGPGHGYVDGLSWAVASGGGHGGAGGPDCDNQGSCAYGGAVNDDPVHPVLMGSGGAEPQSGQCAAGGGLLKIVVINPVSYQLAPATINGTIDMSGGHPCLYPGSDASGGAGGTILLEASAISGNGALAANGGQFVGWGGGGGGGIISLIENMTSFSGSVSVNGGFSNDAHGPSIDGSPGIITFTAAPVTGY